MLAYDILRLPRDTLVYNDRTETHDLQELDCVLVGEHKYSAATNVLLRRVQRLDGQNRVNVLREICICSLYHLRDWHERCILTAVVWLRNTHKRLAGSGKQRHSANRNRNHVSFDGVATRYEDLIYRSSLQVTPSVVLGRQVRQRICLMVFRYVEQVRIHTGERYVAAVACVCSVL